MKEAVVLLSGGLDSATTLYMALDNGYRCHCLIFDYNQRHKKEVSQAKKIARGVNCDCESIKLDFPWGSSALLDKNSKLPAGRAIEDMPKGIPATYVPLRNTIFLSIASGWAEVIGAGVIFIGANAVDFSGYPDCRPGYFEIFNELLKEGTKSGVEGSPVKIETPLVDKKKSEIIKIGTRLMVPYELTWSCYRGGKRPCFKCESCVLREKGFSEAGLKDPLVEMGYAGT